MSVKIPIPDEFEELVCELYHCGSNGIYAVLDSYRACFSHMEAAEKERDEFRDSAGESMNRAEVLKWRQQAHYLGQEPTTQTDMVDCYESLLSRCVPWLEHLNVIMEGQNRAELDALLAEITEVKHGR